MYFGGKQGKMYAREVVFLPVFFTERQFAKMQGKNKISVLRIEKIEEKDCRNLAVFYLARFLLYIIAKQKIICSFYIGRK